MHHSNLSIRHLTNRTAAQKRKMQDTINLQRTQKGRAITRTHQ